MLSEDGFAVAITLLIGEEVERGSSVPGEKKRGGL